MLDKVEFAQMIGKNINYYREKCDLTLEELANKTEYTQGYIDLLEKGSASPDSYVLFQLANTMDIPVASLFNKKR